MLQVTYLTSLNSTFDCMSQKEMDVELKGCIFDPIILQSTYIWVWWIVKKVRTNSWSILKVRNRPMINCLSYHRMIIVLNCFLFCFDLSKNRYIPRIVKANKYCRRPKWLGGFLDSWSKMSVLANNFCEIFLYFLNFIMDKADNCLSNKFFFSKDKKVTKAAVANCRKVALVLIQKAIAPERSDLV